MLVLSCKRATELTEKKSVFQLSWNEQLQLDLHTKICKCCAIYQEQSILLDKIIRHQKMEISKFKPVFHLKNETLKLSIIHRLDEQIGYDYETQPSKFLATIS